MSRAARVAWRALPRPLLLGHRGLRHCAPENSLDAVAAARAAGADGVEVDVRVCQSGELVVIHDSTLERVTAGNDCRPVHALGAAALARVQLAGPAGSTAVGVPQLVEVRRLCHELGLALNIEMKRDVPDRRAVVIATAAVLADTDGCEPLLVSSFDPLMLAGLRVLAPRIPVALLIDRGRAHRTMAHLARPLGAVAIHPERTVAHPARVARWRARGVMVVVWTVNEPSELAALVASGVDGIISDDPATMRVALDRLARPA